jgi:hypothetical protein
VEAAPVAAAVEHVHEVDNPDHAEQRGRDALGILAAEALQLGLQLLAGGEGETGRVVALPSLGLRLADTARHRLRQRYEASALLEHEAGVVGTLHTLQNRHEPKGPAGPAAGEGSVGEPSVGSTPRDAPIELRSGLSGRRWVPAVAGGGRRDRLPAGREQERGARAV